MQYILLLSVVSLFGPLFSACSDEATAQDTSGSSGEYVGTYDDIPVADDDLQALEDLLRAKWSYFIIEMDKYNLARDSSLTEATAEKLELVFADEFEFNAYYSDGSEFGSVQGIYSPLSWVEANDAEEVFGPVQASSTMLIPNYDHILTVEEPGQRMILEGYHEHIFFGEDIRILIGQVRQVAFETICFEKIDGAWRVTDYVEIVYDVTERANPDLPTP